MSMFQANADHPIARIFLDATSSTKAIPTGLCSFTAGWSKCGYPSDAALADAAYALVLKQIDLMFEAQRESGKELVFPPVMYLNYPVESAIMENDAQHLLPSEVYHISNFKTDPSTPQGRLRIWWAHNLAVVASRIDL